MLFNGFHAGCTILSNNCATEKIGVITDYLRNCCGKRRYSCRILTKSGVRALSCKYVFRYGCGQIVISPVRFNVVECFDKLTGICRSDKFHTCILEVRQAFEIVAEVAAHLEYAYLVALDLDRFCERFASSTLSVIVGCGSSSPVSRKCLISLNIHGLP